MISRTLAAVLSVFAIPTHVNAVIRGVATIHETSAADGATIRGTLYFEVCLRLALKYSRHSKLFTCICNTRSVASRNQRRGPKRLYGSFRTIVRSLCASTGLKAVTLTLRL